MCRIAAGRKRFSPDRASDPSLNCFHPLSSVPVPRQPRARRRLPSAVVQSTPEKIQEAVKKLGVNKHRFVHCELANGKVRTEIRGNGYMLKYGMRISQWIRFTNLQAALGPVPAAGTGTELRACKPRLRLLPDDLGLSSQYTQASKIVS